MNKTYITWSNVLSRLRQIDLLRNKVYGVPNGGMIAAGFLLIAENQTDITDANIILDDIIDSGGTREYYQTKFPDKKFYALFDKQKDEQLKGKWIVFPWELQHPGGEENIEQNIVRQLQYIGEDPTREGLADTPKRVTCMWSEIFNGYSQDPEKIFTIFDAGNYNQIILLKNCEIYSMCEHHMMPFFGKIHIAYIPNKKIIGISKLARLVDIYAKRLQIQERIGEQITTDLMKYLEPQGAACIIEATHMCMRMRGVEKQNSTMTTSSMKGSFMDSPAAREELIQLIKG